MIGRKTVKSKTENLAVGTFFKPTVYPKNQSLIVTIEALLRLELAPTGGDALTLVSSSWEDTLK